ncbi:hypothetical protein P3342_006690 [Pyrenophora teres f. teres]|nr:hypothetical protein P3342_006690 [Pyrenophora teres f. teres]
MRPTGRPLRRNAPMPGGAPFQPLSLWTVVLLCIVCCWATFARAMTDEAISELRQETRDMFYHGYDNYIEHAFPEDELRPLTCGPLTRDRQNPAHIEVNDVLGNYSLTLIDSLSTLAILASSPPSSEAGTNRALEDFQDGVKLLVQNYGDGTPGRKGRGARARGFNLDSKVQVFETVIRGVGGLLSAHQFAVGDLPIRGYDAKVTKKKGREGIFWSNGFVYNGQLLRLATDLADRLLPAFNTPTGLPYPRVNLRYGVPFYAKSPNNMDPEHGQCGRDPQDKGTEVTETCSAGAGSLVLEFSVLSRLTGKSLYEKLAKRLFGLCGNAEAALDLSVPASTLRRDSGSMPTRESERASTASLNMPSSRISYFLDFHSTQPMQLLIPLTHSWLLGLMRTMASSGKSTEENNISTLTMPRSIFTRALFELFG